MRGIQSVYRAPSECKRAHRRTFEIRVRLPKLVVSPEVVCELGVTMLSKAGLLSSASGSAKVANAAGAGPDRLAARD